MFLTCIAAKTRVDDLRAHYKNTYNTARAVKGMRLKRAIKYMEDVLQHRQVVPFRKHNGTIGRKAQAKVFKLTQGRYPEKSVKQVLQLLKNLVSNSESKGLDVDKCVVTHVAVQRAVQGRRRTFRAHGRISPYLSSNCHVELFVTEKSANVKKAKDDKKTLHLTKKQAARKNARLAIGK